MSSDPIQIAEFAEWIGRTKTAKDEITAFQINALSATLGRTGPVASFGSVVPPLWHWMYFLPLHPPSEMRPDGHVQGGEFMPPIPLPRRVWAGSKFEWSLDNPLRVGDRVERTSRIASITPKSGQGGELVFVKIVHEYRNELGVALTNEHLSGFRGVSITPTSKVAPVLAGCDADWERVLVPDPVLLFRYSALMFNSHRIHFDWPYATQTENYPAPLVQGPLVATLLMDLLHQNLPAAIVRSLEFKAIRPSYVDKPMRLRGQVDGTAVHLWSADEEGRLTMSAVAKIDGCRS